MIKTSVNKTKWTVLLVRTRAFETDPRPRRNSSLLVLRAKDTIIQQQQQQVSIM